VAPTIVRNLMADYRAAYGPNPSAEHANPTAAPASTTDGAAAAPADTAPAPAAAAAPPTLSDVPTEGAADTDSSTKTVTVVEPATPAASGSSASMGVEVLTPSGTPSTTPGSTLTPNGTPVSNLPAATGAQDPNFGLPAPAAKVSALPPIEKAAPAPDQINDAAGKPEPAAETRNPNLSKKKKTKAPKEDKTDESSSKNKPKKGLDKLNPF
jgi:outer membrane protein assembly factor BamD